MPTVFLDCDGVLADFDAGATRVFGMRPDAFERQFGLKRFWDRLASTPDFFASLDLLPDAMELFEAARHVGPVILTGLPRGDWAEPQKRRWAERHFPGVAVITTTAALKREHCRPGDALVDDRDGYRHLWEKPRVFSSTTAVHRTQSGSCASTASFEALNGRTSGK